VQRKVRQQHTEAASSSDAMKERFGVLWDVKIDDKIDAIDVDAARSLRGNQQNS
jgi:hypothetical protein